ncbi:hypothetical protein K438DRAFT_1761631 [Mycena galopus ATCC 62051]|nr:hypothetical protein K438DRAFT_1761631 [Mycena galopus ATCC 62051]
MLPRMDSCHLVDLGGLQPYGQSTKVKQKLNPKSPRNSACGSMEAGGGGGGLSTWKSGLTKNFHSEGGVKASIGSRRAWAELQLCRALNVHQAWSEETTAKERGATDVRCGEWSHSRSGVADRRTRAFSRELRVKR